MSPFATSAVWLRIKDNHEWEKNTLLRRHSFIRDCDLLQFFKEVRRGTILNSLFCSSFLFQIRVIVVG